MVYYQRDWREQWQGKRREEQVCCTVVEVMPSKVADMHFAVVGGRTASVGARSDTDSDPLVASNVAFVS